MDNAAPSLATVSEAPSPTVLSAAPSLAELSAQEKRALLERLLQKQDAIAPLSYGQQALWFLYRMTPESAAYNCSIAARVRSPIDMPLLRRALQTLIDRHPVLRTTFTTVSGEPMQRVRERVDLSFREEDVRDWSEQALRERVEDEAHRPFDLEHDPMLRAVVFTRSAHEHVLLLTFHHIIGDFMSFALLFDEFLTVWRAERGGATPPLPPAPAPYTDYVRWQAAMLKGPEGARQEAYWERRLAGELPTLNLGDRPRPAVQTFNGAVHAFSLDATLTRRIHALARAEGATPYVVLLAAFQALLHRYTGETDILVGSFAHGRTRPELAKTIGYFVNPVVVRASLAGGPTFRSLISQVRQTTLEALEHQDYPFPLLVERMGATHVAQGGGSAPLFQVAFNMLKPLQTEHEGFSLSALNPDVDGEVSRLDQDGFIIESYPLLQRSVQFDLALTLDDAGDHINGFLEYSADVFSPASVAPLAGSLRAFLAGAAADPARRVGEIPLVAEDERTQIVAGWNETTATYPEQQCLHHLFEQQARRTPDNVAAIYGAEALTYAELDARANKLAHHLRGLGIGPDIPVGVCVDRSLDLVIALFGVLKAGGAYLPLDTDAPSARLLQLLGDAQAPVCIVQERVRERIANIASDAITVVCMEQRETWETLACYPSTATDVMVTPLNLVSIYYTSGSTGQPKGVANTHRGWVNRMAWMQDRYRLAPHETVLQKTTLTFDDAAVEFFWPLNVGARIALMEPGLHRDPRAILDAARQYQAAVAQFVPSMLALVLDAVTPQDRAALSCLREVISSGEALRPDLARLFQERLGCALHNQWGPTEVSIDSTAHTCVDADSAGMIVPVGRPIANTRVYILDARLQPVPVGMAGDLYVAGVGLARGYLDDAARTADAFVPNPFEPGAVMYRTGDRGRYRPDGSIVFLGRLDDQVKIRGQRVELAEIDAALAAYPNVKDCAVVALKQSDSSDSYRLVAYVVPHAPDDGADARGDATTSLRSFLAQRLPEYMVPGWFVLLDTLPVTVSGKVDRKRLPDPGNDRPALVQEYAPPETPAECAIAGIWRQVLGVAQIGSHDSFFELGGHSLDATRVVSRINRELRVELSLREFFESPTVAELARLAERAAAGDDAGLRQPIPRLGPQKVYALSHAQQRFWFQYQLDHENAYGAVLLLDLDGPLHTAAFERALRGFVARHGILRTTFAERDGTPWQIVHDNMEPAHEYRDLSDLDATDRSEVLTQAIVLAARTPYDLATGPLFRTALYRLDEQRRRLFVAMHPIVFDGWSVTVLLQDLKALYHAYKNGESAPDLPPVVQYVDYAAWHNQRLADGDLDAQKQYWLDHLAGYVGQPHLPGDFVTPPLSHAAMRPRIKVIGEELTARLRELSREQGATLYMTLSAGLNMWLAHATGQTDITVSSPLSGRTHTEFEGVFGVLWNPAVLRTDLAGNPSYLQVLERVRANALNAYARQDYPFDLVVQELPRRPGADLYAVAFVLQNASTTALAFDDVGVQVSRSDFVLDGRDPAAERLGDHFNTPYDLHIEVFEADGQLATVTRYNPKRFRAETVDRFLDDYVSVLEGIAADPHLRLSQLQSPTTADLDDLFADVEDESA